MNWKMVVVLILLLIQVVYAGEGRTFEVDFNISDEYDLWLKKSDRVLFEYGGYNHTIIIDEIKSEVVEADVFLFLEAGLHNPNYIHLNKKYDIGLDFNRDGNKELAIALANINNDQSRGKIIFTKLESWDGEAELDPFWENEDSEVDKKTGVYIIGGIVLLLLIFLVGFFRRRKEGIYY